MARFLVPAGVFAALVAFLYLGLERGDPSVVPSPLVGKPAPEFSLARVRNAQETLTKSDLLGKVSLINVWASWCVSCRAEHPILLRVAAEKLVPIYGLNYKDAPNDAVRWLDRLGDPYTASGSDIDGRVGLDLGVYGVPETFLIDKAGNIAYKHIGPVSPQAWENELLPRIKALQGDSG
ncbi:MAG: cytochrome c biogenesis protein CcmG/thiol:disulfide interchange protein DsbE [Gammaproteobacteria bacterium]|jgi:cytochrome c biogenesis protein CcmG/thiol:disulfide interchange protein DsbE